jgi:hypothetical protein
MGSAENRAVLDSSIQKLWEPAARKSGQQGEQ